MISNSNSINQQSLFTNPQTLEHIRHQLHTLVSQDRHSFQILIEDFQMFLNQKRQQILQNNHEKSVIQVKQLEFLKQIGFTLKEKSYSITVLAQLATKMIDFILQQQQRNLQLEQQYQTNIDNLRDQNECLTQKNIYIEKDIEYFREHLRATEDQLQKIIISQSNINGQPHEKQVGVKYLQQQIEKIREQLQIFRFSTKINKSDTSINSNLQVPKEINTSEPEQNKVYQDLQKQNTLLRQQIQLYEINLSSKSIQICQIPIKQQIVEQTDRIPAKVYQPKKSFNQFQTQINQEQINQQVTNKQLSRKKCHSNAKINATHFQNDSHSQEQGLDSHNRLLSNQWSLKSFNLGTTSIAKLIYFNQQSQQLEENSQSKSSRFQIHGTKSTEKSTKSICFKNIFKQTVHVGVNTQQISIDGPSSFVTIAQNSQTFNQQKHLIIIQQLKNMSKSIEQLYLLKGIATQHMKQAKYTQAVVYFKDVLAKFNQEVHQITSEQQMQKAIRQLQLASHKNLSLCYLKLQNYQNCVTQCQTVLQVEPNNLKIIYRIGRAYIEMKNYQLAEKYLKKGFYLDPQEKEIMKALEEIQTAKNPPTKQITKNNWSFSEVLTWIFVLIITILKYPFTGKKQKEVKKL